MDSAWARTDALFSVRGQANVLSRLTAIFAGIFFFLSLLMAWSMSGPAPRDLDHGPPAGRPDRSGDARRRGTSTWPAAPAAPAQPAAPTR